MMEDDDEHNELEDVVEAEVVPDDKTDALSR